RGLFAPLLARGRYSDSNSHPNSDSHSYASSHAHTHANANAYTDSYATTPASAYQPGLHLPGDNRRHGGTDKKLLR
ncbi:MAG: hypothetical protein WCL37_06900, partial [Chrysiogenales bacterium]